MLIAECVEGYTSMQQRVSNEDSPFKLMTSLMMKGCRRSCRMSRQKVFDVRTGKWNWGWLQIVE